MAFTWFDKFTEAIAAIPDKEQRVALIVAIVEYGANGTEPELDWPLNVVFMLAKEDIDNSKDARMRGEKGGRPKSKKQAGGEWAEYD